MKKTLIALAALASTAAFAQSVTLSGNYTAGYVSDKAAGAARNAGLGTDTARLQADVSEDLGGGLKASASVSVAGLNRAGTVAGENAFVQLAGNGGTVKIGAVEAGAAYDLGMGMLQGGHGMDGKVLAGNVTVDSLSYTAPAMGDITISAGYADYSSAAGAAGAYGTTGVGASQPSGKVGAAYAAGPLSAALTVVNYTRRDLAVNAAKVKTIVGAQYNLGVAKVGAAYYSTSREGSSADNATAVGVSVPMGNLTLGANYTSSESYSSTNAATAAVKKSGYVLAANYALSKRTGIQASSYSWKTDGTAGNNTGFRVLLGHSF